MRHAVNRLVLPLALVGVLLTAGCVSAPVSADQLAVAAEATAAESTAAFTSTTTFEGAEGGSSG